MNAQCPLCFATLETCEVAPCMDCGNDPQELQHCAEGKHTYAEYLIFGPLSLVLCDFCHVDFASYDPTYFGLPQKARVDPWDMSLVREVIPCTPTFDKVCPECRRRLSFLEFVAAAREFHHASELPA
ncbi:MAG: hypothetical protein ACO1TE_17360 [Prosthecobacter sp.]